MHIKRFNEATEQEIQEINQILNIARDEGYRVMYQETPKPSSQIKTPYAFIIKDDHDNREFYDMICNIHDRLYNMGHLHNDPAHLTQYKPGGPRYGLHVQGGLQPFSSRAYFTDGKAPDYEDYTYDNCLIFLL